MVRYLETIEPVPENVKKYNDIYDIYKNLYSALNDNSIYSQFAKLK